MQRESAPAPFAHILAPVDGSTLSEIAVRRSEALLTFPGCRLTLLNLGRGEGRLGRVENLAAEARGWGAETDVLVRKGQPAAEVLREIETGKYDLVLMMSRRRSLAGGFPGDVATAVLRNSPVPLLFFRPLAGLGESFFAVERSEPAKFRRLILMLDGSVQAEAVMDSACRLSRAFHSELILFHSISRGDATEDRMESARAYLAERAEEANRLGISARIQIAVGEPAAQALRLLDGGVDGIALTTRGRSYWGSTLLGSVARQVLSVAEGPILCLSSHGVRQGGARRVGARSRPAPLLGV
ncbi:MAG TPA: universal stress protein [Planctomycetota bacterium]|nr:universal stress protein [Planctomycetota bacterium]